MKRLIFFAITLILTVFAGCSVKGDTPPVTVPSPDSIPIITSAPTPDPEYEPTPEPTPTPPPPVKIQLAGDVLLHSKVTKTAAIGDGKYDFSPYFTEIAKYIIGDLNIVNIETPIDVFGENKNLSSYPLFNAPYEILEAVRDMGFNLFVNANNHCVDKGWDGLLATRENFKKAGVDFTGTSVSTDEGFYIKEINGIKFGVIAYTDSLNGLDSWVPEDKRDFAVRRFSSAGTGDTVRMIEDIKRCREDGAEFVIVSLHWGVEYVNAPSSAQVEIAHALAQGGADIVMGNHAHCVQPIELAEREDGSKSLIIYALGNFFADQNDMESPIRKTQYSMLVNVTVERGKSGKPEIVEYSNIPTFVYRYTEKDSSTGVGYKLLPSGDFLDNEEFFANSSDYARNREAYDHVTSITG